jgi:lipid-binding SYLF domain-containing protein
MKKLLLSATIVGLLLSGISPVSTVNQVVCAASATKIEQRATKTLTLFKTKVKGADEILGKAKGMLIMPAIYQGGIGIGGKYGEGVLKVDGKTIDYYNMVAASYGLQLGGAKKSIIIAFMEDSALQEFRQSNGYEFGVNASATVVNVGADGHLNITDLNKPILVFAVDQKGLMYDLSLTGSKFTKINR